MKVLMINSVCGIRSTGRICTDLAQALEARGHEVRIAYGREQVPERFAPLAHRIGTDLGVRLHGVKARLFDASGFGSAPATRAFLRWVRDYDPDVIHLHNIHGYYLHAGLLFDYLRSSGKRVIWTLHDTWAFTGHSPFCLGADCLRWQTGCFQCPLRDQYPAALLDRSAANYRRKAACFHGVPDLTVVTPSQWLSRWVGESFLRDYPVRVIHNGIDTKAFRPTPSDFRSRYGLEGKRIFLGVSTDWNPLKGLEDYVRLSKLLSPEEQIVLVGLTPAQAKTVPSEVLCLPRTDSVADLAALYTQADLVLNLSYSENYPTVNLEALACGTPVFTYDTGGSGESARLCGGAVVPRGDLEGLLAAIRAWPWTSPPAMPDPAALDSARTVEAYLALYEAPLS